MRLEHIKLAGFKSFVDPTVVPFPSNLAAVVGPNGCGKSNIIDAVRWVMGESSAKYLRGESMADVIFNGSSSRKPAGQASIELHFDNSDGSLGGPYAQYNEIVIRRQVNLDGQSTYYLNGTVCRRRDITDIFLGTGLGPRSYAIIEQGTISRLIEAKPEELRIYLEEAAGISKYKERRRETELRIQHTRDNLARLTDLRDELQKQLDHLEKQAAAAEKYQTLKSEERTFKAQLLALRGKFLQRQSEKQQASIQEQSLKLDALQTELQSLDTQRELMQAQQIESADAVQEVQRQYYGLNTELARIEQTIQHQRERRHQLQTDLQEVIQMAQEASQQLVEEQKRATELQQQQEHLLPALSVMKENADQARMSLHHAETAMHQWQIQWDEFNQQASHNSQQVQVEQTRIQHVEQHILQIEQRLQRIQNEQETYTQTELPLGIEALQEQIEQTTNNIAHYQEKLNDVHSQLQMRREENHLYNESLDDSRSKLQTFRGRYASLTALQEAALGKTAGEVMGWLEQHQLDKQPRLAENLHVENGWELAVETVLGNYLEALCVPHIENLLPALKELNQGTLTLLINDNNETQGLNDTIVNPVAIPLKTKLQTLAPIRHLVEGIYVVESLTDAYKLLEQLAPNESVITRDAIWLGKCWLRIAKNAEQKAGVIQRERELNDIQKEISLQVATIENLQQKQEESRAAIVALEIERDTLQKQISEFSAAHAELNAQLRIQQAQLSQFQQRKVQLAHEYEELKYQQEQEKNVLKQAREKWQEMLQHMEKDTANRNSLIQQRDQYRQIVETARQGARQLQDEAHQLAVQVEVLQTQIKACKENQQRFQKQSLASQERQGAIQQQLNETDDPQSQLESDLQQLLEQQQIVEKNLQEKRVQLSTIEDQLRLQDKQRHQLDNQLTILRTELEQQRLSHQSVEVRLTTIHEQLTESGYEFAAVQETLPVDASEETWEKQLERINSRIERLGPINLAAISEFATQAERKTYLDKQNQDLITALETLEDAIRKIDRETRTRFKEIFDKVNSGFQQLFPRVFGGGNAYLELSGEDLLDTGISVIARPPGKRNSTIHLLSGGEKALTAIALVFAIFQLNPAPFCMLDEVDAPLDDANIGRFCELVKEMSKSVQFIFISHNKLAIEMAEHLIGVTMHEPGVSRLVAVDVNAAIEMAAA